MFAEPPPSVLGRLNPAVKLLTVMAALLSVTFTVHWPTLLALAVTAAIATITLGRVPAKRLLTSILIVAIPALSLLIQFTFYAELPLDTPAWFKWGPLTAHKEGLYLGMAIWVRVLAISSFSFLFVLTTDPTAFALSLMQQARLPHNIGYGLLIAYRFLPVLRREYETIQAAQQVRGLGLPESFRQRVRRLFQSALPLLAAGIRKAGRAAVAMDARGFGQAQGRTYYRTLRVSWHDAVFAGAVIVTVVAAFWLL